MASLGTMCWILQIVCSLHLQFLTVLGLVNIQWWDGNSVILGHHGLLLKLLIGNPILLHMLVVSQEAQ